MRYRIITLFGGGFSVQQLQPWNPSNWSNQGWKAVKEEDAFVPHRFASLDEAEAFIKKRKEGDAFVPVVVKEVA